MERTIPQVLLRLYQKKDFPQKVSYKKMICANAAAQPFPGIGFQITNEEVLTDDLPCYEQKTNDRRRLIWYPQKSRKSLEHWILELRIAAGPKQTLTKPMQFLGFAK